MQTPEDWYAFALADGTPLLAWHPQIGRGADVMQVTITLDEDSARSADAVWQVLDVPHPAEGHVDVRVVLEVRPEVLAALGDAWQADGAPERIAAGSFVDDDAFAALHRVESFTPVEWRVDEVVELDEVSIEL